MAGVPIVAAVGASSSPVVKMAQARGQTPFAFFHEGRCNAYAGEERIRRRVRAGYEHPLVMVLPVSPDSIFLVFGSLGP